MCLTLPSWSMHRNDSSLHSSVPRRSGWLPGVAASAPSPVQPALALAPQAPHSVPPSTFPRQLGILLGVTGHSPPSSAVEGGPGFGGGTLRQSTQTHPRPEPGPAAYLLCVFGPVTELL